MRSFALIVSVFVMAAASDCAAQTSPEPTPVDGNITWVFDYEEGKRIAKEEDKPMFVVFRCER